MFAMLYGTCLQAIATEISIGGNAGTQQGLAGAANLVFNHASQ